MFMNFFQTEQKEKSERTIDMHRNIFLIKFINGFKELFTHKWKAVIFISYLITVFLTWHTKFYHYLIPSTFPSADLFYMVMDLFFAILAFLVFLWLITTLGTPFGSERIQKNMENIGFINHAKQTPILLTIYRDRYQKNKAEKMYTFNNRGIPLAEWEKRVDELEIAINRSIFVIHPDYTHKHLIILGTEPYKPRENQKLLWKKEYLNNDRATLVLGEPRLGKAISVSLASLPHWLIGGSTGSGKTVLLKSILAQCIIKGMCVYILDNKGGLDFSHPIWKRKCKFAYNLNDFLSTIQEVMEIFEERKELLRNADCPNIDIYNDKTGTNLPRVVVGCDEISDLLNKQAISKEDKTIIQTIEAHLCTLARLSRATGIHLILATQRPSADVIPGQLRSNITYKLCGISDSNLSMVVLDSAIASTIPKDAHGQFITNMGESFRAYWFEEKDYF